MLPRRLVSVFSALAQTKTLRCLEVKEDHSYDWNEKTITIIRRSTFWQWLTYALFSYEANHDIKVLGVDAYMIKPRHAAVVRQTLESSDPFEIVLRDIEVENMTIDIPAGVEIKLEGAGVVREPKLTKYVTTGPLSGLRMVDEDAKKREIRFIYPWWGLSRVSKTSVGQIQRCRSDPQQISTTPRGVHHLRFMRLAPNRVDGIPCLLEIIGEHVKRVDFHSGNDDYWFGDLDTLVTAAVRHCPQLETLDLHQVNMNSFQCLVDAYAQGVCKVKRLLLRKRRVESDSSIIAFFNALSDPIHPLAKHLEELEFSWHTDKVLAMLPKNQRLHVIRVFGGVQQSNEMADKFKKFDGQELAEDVPMRCKLAFVSVMETAKGVKRQRSDDVVSVKIPSLATPVVGNILAFAADRVARRCVLVEPLGIHQITITVISSAWREV